MKRTPPGEETKADVKREAKNPPSRPKKEKQPAPPWKRRIFMVLRTLLIPLLCLTALIAGLLIGYAVVGDQPAGDVFKWGTWQHLFDLIFADS
ncbi:hypothetical protein GCM10027018_31160 [Paenibacillus thermoaerophilus]|jgi:hypothetical protein